MGNTALILTLVPGVCKNVNFTSDEKQLYVETSEIDIDKG